jgi:zinc protease
MMARTIGEVRSWLAPELSHGAIEISVVGDMEIEAVISAVGKTFGALPNREPKPSLDGARKVSFPPVPFNKDFGIDSEIPKAAVAVYWPTNDGIDIRRQRRLYMLGEILNDRLRVRIREQLGSAYSPQVGTVASDVFPGYGYTGALILVDPAKAREIQEVTVGIAAEMAASGTTQDEVDRAKNPTLTHIVETERNNGYWMTVLGRAQERPEVLDWARTRRADFASISKEDMDALAKAYFGADHASRVIIHPYATQAASPLQASPVPANPQKREEPPPDGM